MVALFRPNDYTLDIALNDDNQEGNVTRHYKFTVVILDDPAEDQLAYEYELFAADGEDVFIPLQAYREAIQTLFAGDVYAPNAHGVRVKFTEDTKFFIRDYRDIDNKLISNIMVSGATVKV